MPLRIAASLLVIFAASCSFSSDLVIWNQSDIPIDVAYDLRYRIEIGSESSTPAFAGKPNGKWKILDRAEYDVSNGGHRVTVRVPAGVALRLKRASGYTGPSLEALDTFPVLGATIRVGDRSTELSGDRAILAFKEWNDRLFVYVVRGAA